MTRMVTRVEMAREKAIVVIGYRESIISPIGTHNIHTIQLALSSLHVRSRLFLRMNEMDNPSKFTPSPTMMVMTNLAVATMPNLHNRT